MTLNRPSMQHVQPNSTKLGLAAIKTLDRLRVGTGEFGDGLETRLDVTLFGEDLGGRLEDCFSLVWIGFHDC